MQIKWKTNLLLTASMLIWFANSQASASDSMSELSSTTLKNSTYVLKEFLDKPVRLRNGKAEGKFDSIFGWFVKLEKLALGDLNGDGKGDGAVVIGYNGGGSGYFLRLIAMLNNNGRARQAAITELGDRVQIEKLSINKEIVTLTMQVQGPMDSNADLSIRRVIRYRLKGNKWIKLSQIDQSI